MITARYKTDFQLYPYKRVADQDSPEVRRHPVVIVGGGPIGMALALDLGKRGIACLIVDDHDGVGHGSRAICFAKRTLEICDRLGCGDAMVEKGVVWNRGRVYRDDEEVYSFNLLPEAGHHRPAFINLQQPWFEKFIVDEIRRQQAAGAPIEIRGQNAVTAITPGTHHVALEIDTPDGPYPVEADWVIATDGANSPVRGLLGLGFEGRTFEDNFLIADIRMHADFPVERRFWFDPPFNRGQTALLHKQPDDIWRLDFQLGWDIDRQAELDDENVRARVRGMIGEQIDFELVWKSIYTFRCCTMENYRHGRIFFAGDSAHQVSPFGARGANGGIQDIDNLGWKLALVIQGLVPETLLDSYQSERKQAALENIKASSRAADFLTPRSYAHALFREAVLDLVRDHDFVRPMVNSGRLSVPCTYDGSALNGDDALPDAPASIRPGSPCPDAPLGEGFLLDRLHSGGFTLLGIDIDVPAVLNIDGIDIRGLRIDSTDDPSNALAERYRGMSGSAVYLIRPDQYVVARWAAYYENAVTSAFRRGTGRRGTGRG